MASVPAARAPWHLWAVGLVSLLWNGFGAYDFWMSMTRNADYLANFPPEMIALLDSFPAWAESAWAVGVWSSVAGSLLLLARSRWAATAFLLSLAGALVSLAYQLTLDVPPALGEMSMVIMPLVILVVIVLQWFYSRRMAAARVLR